MEKTLILLKPDCVQKKHVGDVLSRLEKENFTILGVKMLALDDAVLREHYAHIADKPFYPEVQQFMQQSPVVAVALGGDNIVERVRTILGPTDSRQAAPGTIRGDFGVDKMVNVVHASDSVENAQAELIRFFRPEEIFG